MQDVEEGAGGSGGKGRRRRRLQRHLDTGPAVAGDRPEWVSAFLQEFKDLFGDLVLNLAINADLDGKFDIRESEEVYAKAGRYVLLIQRR
jgi:hypothetical protein